MISIDDLLAEPVQALSGFGITGWPRPLFEFLLGPCPVVPLAWPPSLGPFALVVRGCLLSVGGQQPISPHYLGALPGVGF